MKKILWIVVALMVIIIIGLVAFLLSEQEKDIGSVGPLGTYHGTSTTNIGGIRNHTTKTQHLVQTGQTILGSIIVASTTQHEMIIRNSTSTGDNVSTTVMTLPSLLPQGTYTFDISLDDGLVVDVDPGFNGDYVITFR
jgi:hypothetical protein